MPNERYRRNIHNEDRQTYMFENAPTKKETMDGLYRRIGTLSHQAQTALKKGDKKEAEDISKLEAKAISTLRKLAKSKSRKK
jgi:hypothetical protein